VTFATKCSGFASNCEDKDTEKNTLPGYFKVIILYQSSTQKLPLYVFIVGFFFWNWVIIRAVRIKFPFQWSLLGSLLSGVLLDLISGACGMNCLLLKSLKYIKFLNN